ncbi:hypothetical protein FOZ62_017784 [Perkinsus olseni]|uniref:Uncharacterized protein n=1 Tax=Perkinsus olseni TaxID=32597 RepID=A0A7J6QV31_PEROL|nr:hypothetical protein FOZ62_017784 [Perkinsus olseni]
MTAKDIRIPEVKLILKERRSALVHLHPESSFIPEYIKCACPKGEVTPFGAQILGEWLSPDEQKLDDKFIALLDSISYDTTHDIDVEADLYPSAGAAFNQPLLDDEMFLNLGEVVEGQYDDDDLFKVRRALRLGRLLP